MRKGLLTELIAVFEDAKDMLGSGDPSAIDAEEERLDALREEVLGLLREGDRLRRRWEGPPSSKRSRRLPDAPVAGDQAGVPPQPESVS